MSTKKRFFIFLAFFNGIICPVMAQPAEFIKLIQLAKDHPNDTIGVNALLKFTSDHCLKCDDSIRTAVKYPLEAYRRSVKLQYNKGIIVSSIQIGDILRQIKEESKAIEYYYNAINFSKSGNYKQVRSAFQGLGLIYLIQEKYPEAIRLFELTDSINSKHYNDPNYNTATYLKAYCLNNMKQYSNALRYLNIALNRETKQGNQHRLTEIRVSMAKSLSGLGMYDSAIALFKSEMKNLKERKVYQGLILTNLGMAEIFRKQGDLKNALKYAIEAHSYGKIVKDSLFQLRETTILLSKLYQETGDADKAYFFLQQHINAKDSINKRDVVTQLGVTQARLDFKKTEDRMLEEIEEGKQKRLRLNLMLVFSALILILISISLITVRKERRKSENLLLNILPVETAKELKQYGKAIPKKHTNVSIIFCDFVNFTTNIEKLSPETLVSLLDHYFSGFDDIISQHGIEKIKTIGDAYMCVSGLNGDANHAIKAVKASLEILQFMKSERETLETNIHVSFEIRIGIHSGAVISGVVGKRKYAYDIWGDDVNIAARMEQRSEPGCINISQSTFELVKNQFSTESRGKLSAKNKGDLEMYYVTNS